jgi:hypothetical protein
MKLKRAGLDPAAEQSRRGQKLIEENQLPQRRHRRVRIPFHMKAPDHSVSTTNGAASTARATLRRTSSTSPAE